jgi:hypothetical protein
MGVSFNGISLRPVQSLTINQSSDFSENGKLKKYLFNISISGKIVAAQNITIDNRHEEIKSKVEQLLNAFKNVDANSNTFLDIQSENGAAPIKFIPRIKSVQVQEGTWVDFADYSIDLEADEIFIGSTKIPSSDLSETLYDKDDNWSINYSDEDTKFITANHSISARAKDTSTKKGWEIAKEYVDEQINISGNLIPEEIDSATGRPTAGKPLVNKKLKYDVSILNGQVNADIELTFHNPLSSPTQDDYATHDQTITENESRESILKSINVEGNITGLLNIGSNEVTGEERYANALALWEIVKDEIESEYSDKNLLTKSITQDKFKGTISYTYEYNDSENIFGGKSENITISQTEATQVVVVNDAINNQGDGPIFQDISTKKAKTKTVTIDVISDSNIVPDTSTYSPSIDAILESDSVQYSLNNGKVTRTTSWTWV